MTSILNSAAIVVLAVSSILTTRRVARLESRLRRRDADVDA